MGEGHGFAYGARAVEDGGELIQHSFWLFETEADARAAETVFNSLRRCRSARCSHQRRRLEVIAQM